MSAATLLSTRLFTLVYLEDATDCAHFRTIKDAIGWAERQYGRKWHLTLMLWNNTTDAEVQR